MRHVIFEKRGEEKRFVTMSSMRRDTEIGYGVHEDVMYQKKRTGALKSRIGTEPGCSSAVDCLLLKLKHERTGASNKRERRNAGGQETGVRVDGGARTS